MLAIRGAISVDENTREEILTKTRTLLEEVLQRNRLQADEIISIIFTATPDLNAAFPAAAARELGLTRVALLDAVEIDVPSALPKTVRLLLLADRPHNPEVARHVYLGLAANLRPDIKN